MVTFGLGVPAVPPQGGSPREFYPALVAEAKAAGFTRLWVGDHAAWHTPRLECFGLLAALAAWSDLALGSSVALAPLRHPVWLAKSAATLDTLTGGRFVLGLGVGGEYADEFALLDVDPRRRGQLTNAAIAICRRAWAGLLHPGLTPLPVARDIPIWVGGRSPAAAKRAGVLADGYMGLFLQPERFRQMAAAVRAHRRSVDRPGSARCAMLVWIACGSSAGAARAAAALVGREYRLAPDRFLRHIVAGTPQAIAARLKEYVDAGAEHIQIQVAHQDVRSQVKMLGDHVLGDFAS